MRLRLGLIRRLKEPTERLRYTAVSLTSVKSLVLIYPSVNGNELLFTSLLGAPSGTHIRLLLEVLAPVLMV